MPKKTDPKRRVYHVTPRMEATRDIKAKALSWEVKLAGGKRASAVKKLKSHAIAYAKELAKKAPLGQVKIHGTDGKIQREFTYGKDPVRYPG